VNLATYLRVLELGARDLDDTDGRTVLERAKGYVDNRTFRAELVTDLPLSAPPGYLMVKAGDINLYIGAGLANPLRKIPTQVV
jgi:hypothetical protein